MPRKKGKGVVDKKPSILQYDYEVVCGSSAADYSSLPESYMLPEDRIPTCRDQGFTGQCTCFCAAGILEIFDLIKTGERKMFSTTYPYGRHRSPDIRGMYGMWEENLLRRMTLLGTVPLEDFPELLEAPEAYDAVYNAPNLEELDRKAIETKFGGYVAIKDGDFTLRCNKVKEAIIRYQIPAYGVFQMDGMGHAVPIVGWDSKKFYYMNSWGPSYGDNGLCGSKYNKFKRAYIVFDDGDFPLFPFTDIAEEHWAYHAAYRCYNAGIIKGVDDTHFAPESDLTLAQIAQIIYNLAKAVAAFKNEKFIDTKYDQCKLDKDLWYYKAMNYCYWKDIIVDLSNPDGTITRAEFCDIISSFIETHCFSKAIAKCTILPMSFEDVEQTDTAIAKCFSLQLINGFDEKTFKPEDTLLRGQTCQIIYKLIKLIEMYEGYNV